MTDKTAEQKLKDEIAYIIFCGEGGDEDDLAKDIFAKCKADLTQQIWQELIGEVDSHVETLCVDWVGTLDDCSKMNCRARDKCFWYWRFTEAYPIIPPNLEGCHVSLFRTRKLARENLPSVKRYSFPHARPIKVKVTIEEVSP